MQTKRITSIIIISLAFVLCACTASKKNSSSMDSWDLNQAQVDSLMQQIADDAYPEKTYEQYMPQGVFAETQLFGLEKDGDDGTAYVMLKEGAFVVIKEKAYEQSGGNGEAIVKFSYTDDEPKLKEVIWSADGEAHEKWIKDNFSKDSLKAWESFGENDYKMLMEKLNKKAEMEMGVPVETEYTLMIDDEQGTYEIFEAIESGEGENYTFDTKTIYSGKLSDLAKEQK